MDLRSLNRSFAWRKDVIERHRSICERLGERRTHVSKCPMCSSAAVTAFTVVREFPFAECDACRHVFMTSPPDPDAVHDFYSADKEARAAQAKIYVDDALFAKRVEQIARPKVAFIADVTPPKGVWFDVGCATGEVLAAARDAGWVARGVETDPTEVAFARARGLDVLEQFVTPSNARELLADTSVLSLLNILEHVNDPSSLLSGLASALPTGAHVVIEVPRHPSLSSLANMLFPSVASRHMYSPEHLHVFSEAALSRMLDTAQLTAVAIWTFGQDFQELISSASLAAGAHENRFIEGVFGLAPRLQQAIDDADFSDVMFLVAQKR
jgi:SAM-dependent methyltransferase